MKERVEQLDPQFEKFERFYHRYRLTPSIVFGKSMVTQQFALTLAGGAVRIIEPSSAQLYMIGCVDMDNTVFIGNTGVTVQSGFALIPQLTPIVFAMAENAELWAIASANVTLFLLKMGL